MISAPPGQRLDFACFWPANPYNRTVLRRASEGVPVRISAPNPAPFLGLRAVLFDFGGTLDSDGGHWFDRTCRLYADHSAPVDIARLKDAFYAADTELEGNPEVREVGLRALMDRHLALQVRRLGLRGIDVAAHLADAFVRPMEASLAAARPVLAALKRRYRLGVVSNFYGNLPAILRESGLAPLLDVVVDSALAGVKKPDPEIFRLALRRLETDAAGACMVGDSLARDLAPARALGMRTIWIHEPEKRAEPGDFDAEVTHLPQILDLLRADATGPAGRPA